MKYISEKYRRRSIRLRGYDYRLAGLYFVTVCTQNRECLLGAIIDGKMTLNAAGEMVRAIWEDLPAVYSGVDIDEFAVMPNHVHGIIVLINPDPNSAPPELGDCPPKSPTMSLPDVMQRFKSLRMTDYRRGVANRHWPPFAGRFWQRNYYEHIIRNDDELNHIREYIARNPEQWSEDENNPACEIDPT